MAHFIRSFPEAFPLINEHVAELRLWYPMSKEELPLEDQLVAGDSLQEWGYYEFFIELKDGRCFGFYGCTPEFLRDYFDTEHELSFTTTGVIALSEISIDAILDAIEKALGHAPNYELGQFGYECPCPPDSDQEDEEGE